MFFNKNNKLVIKILKSIIANYKPTKSFTELVDKLFANKDKNLRYSVNEELRIAAKKRINFLLNNDKKIDEYLRENKSMVNGVIKDEPNKYIFKCINAVANVVPVSNVEDCCDKLVNEGYEIFNSYNVRKYLNHPEITSNWLKGNNREAIVSTVSALALVEHIEGDPKELRKISLVYPDIILKTVSEKIARLEQPNNKKRIIRNR